MREGREVDFTIDMPSASAVRDCGDCLVGFPVAIERMRAAADETEIPEAIAAHTRRGFAKADLEKEDLRLAAGYIDHFYRHISRLEIMDKYTRAYVRATVRPFFEQLKSCGIHIYYILDNSLRIDRLRATIELFELAGLSVVTPYLHGSDWTPLKDRIRIVIASGSHLAYVEPDATVNHIASARELAGEFSCVTFFRNLGPEDPRFFILAFPDSR